MTAITFESVFAQARQLAPGERAQLIGALAKDLAQFDRTPFEKISLEERRALIREFRGKYRGSLSSVDEFLAAKHEEVELEEARYLARHPEVVEEAQ